MHPNAPESSPSPLSCAHRHCHCNHNGRRARNQPTTAGPSNSLCTGGRGGNGSAGCSNRVAAEHRDRCPSGVSSEAATPTERPSWRDRRPTRRLTWPRLAHAPPEHAAMELADSEGIFQNFEGALRHKPRERRRRVRKQQQQKGKSEARRTSSEAVEIKLDSESNDGRER